MVNLLSINTVRVSNNLPLALFFEDKCPVIRVLEAFAGFIQAKNTGD